MIKWSARQPQNAKGVSLNPVLDRLLLVSITPTSGYINTPGPSPDSSPGTSGHSLRSHICFTSKKALLVPEEVAVGGKEEEGRGGVDFDKVSGYVGNPNITVTAAWRHSTIFFRYEA